MFKQALAILSSVALGACSVVGVRSSEEPPHRVIARLGEAEIREYAPRLVAETEVEADENAARSEGFRRLAGYIFGTNRGERRIAMTAPVAQEPSRIAMTAPVAQDPVAEGFRIRFFLPAGLTAATAPEPNDPRVRIATLPAETFAVLRFTGSTDPAVVARNAATLRGMLAGSRWDAVGEAPALFYDPPWTLPPLRRNEVAIRVTPAA